jgi:Glycosyl transferase family 2
VTELRDQVRRKGRTRFRADRETFLMLNTPVILSVFNRPASTARVFEAIAQAKPRQLFVFADGPSSAADTDLCAQARAVVEKVSWDCDVKYRYSDTNLGARECYKSGVDWAFSEVDEGIILDDDCVPDPTFFLFSQDMLERYRHQPRVMMICGTNYLGHWKEDCQSYHFSHFGSVWGWASWKRAWAFYDASMSAWGDEKVRERIRDLFANDDVFTFQARRFDRLYGEPQDRHSWDLPWSLARLVHSGLTIVPSVNLVANIGNIDGRGLPPDHPLANLDVAPLESPFRSPPVVAVDREYDELHTRRIFEWFEVQALTDAEARRRSRTIHRRLLRRIGKLQHGVLNRQS